MTTLTSIELSQLDSALLTRHHMEVRYASSLRKRYENEVGETEAQISDLQRILINLQSRLVGLHKDVFEANTKEKEALTLLSSVKARILSDSGAGGDQASFDLEVSPNGTVTTLSKKET